MKFIGNTHFPDPRLAEIFCAGLQFHAQVSEHVDVADQIDETKFNRAVVKAIAEHAEQNCPKLKVATLFRENKSGKDGIIPAVKPEFYAGSTVMNVVYTAMPKKKEFIRETTNIVRLPITRLAANNNIGSKQDETHKQREASVRMIVHKVAPVSRKVIPFKQPKNYQQSA